MSSKPIPNKLQIKENYKILLINEPEGYRSLLGTLPSNATITSSHSGPVDLIQVFATSKEELESQLNGLKAILTPKVLLWVTYPKGTSKVKTDLNGDVIATYAKTIDLQAIAMVSIDQTWSALRLKII